MFLDKVDQICENFSAREILGLLTDQEFERLYETANRLMQWDEEDQDV